MNIGEAAREAGLTAKAARRYEELGLVRPGRSPNGYRAYGPAEVSALRFIRHARELAFPIAEIRRLLALQKDQGRASADVRRIALGHVEALEAKAEALRAIAAGLRGLADCCAGDQHPDCPILEELQR